MSNQDSLIPISTLHSDNPAAISFCNGRHYVKGSGSDGLRGLCDQIKAPDVTYNTLQAWLSMKLAMRKAAICQADDCAGACYFNSDKLSVAITITTSPHTRVDQKDWLIGQQGNNLD